MIAEETILLAIHARDDRSETRVVDVLLANQMCCKALVIAMKEFNQETG